MSGDFVDHILLLSLGDGDDDFLAVFDCFKVKVLTAFKGPCLVVEGDPFRLTRCAVWLVWLDDITKDNIF